MAPLPTCLDAILSGNSGSDWFALESLDLRGHGTYANASAGKQSILVPAGFSIALTSELPGPTDAVGVDIVGDGASLDGAGTGPADNCILIATPQTRIFGFEIRNCRRSPLRLAFGAAGSQFSRLNVHDNSQAIVLNDANVTFGPYNEVSRSAGHCISVVGEPDTIKWNFIHDCATRGIDLTGSSSGALVIGNVITGCNPAIFFGNVSNDCVLAHNVLHANAGDGVWMAGVSNTGNRLQNNSFSNNAGYGVRTDDSEFSANDHNDYFGNALGTCSACSSLGAGSLTTDPGYVDAVSNDFRLRASSPCINAGIDTGQDVNGPEPGNGLFNGSNPDIGAREKAALLARAEAGGSGGGTPAAGGSGGGRCAGRGPISWKPECPVALGGRLVRRGTDGDGRPSCLLRGEPTIWMGVASPRALLFAAAQRVDSVLRPRPLHRSGTAARASKCNHPVPNGCADETTAGAS